MNKLKKDDGDDDIDEADDVMGDVAYRNRKGAGAARRELFTSLGDEAVRVSEDGVMGGTNDAVFGGKHRFGKLNNNEAYSSSNNDATPNMNGAGDGTERDNVGGGGMNDTSGERGADGAAMSDDFYTRDVGAEYEELDYDVEEQFDDDDVDVGEGEVVMDENANFGAEDELDDDDDDSDDDVDDSAIGGAEGLASVAGFKALLAKARGEAIQIPGNSASAGTSDGGDGSNVNGIDPMIVIGMNGNNNTDSTKNNVNSSSLLDHGNSNNKSIDPSTNNNKGNNKRKRDPDEDLKSDHFSKIVAAARLANATAKKKRMEQQPQNKANNMGNDQVGVIDSNPTNNTVNPTMEANADTSNPSGGGVGGGIQVDEYGLRIITLQAVQKEIWLNHGSITMKKLMKIFNVSSKSSKTRQSLYRDVVKELCTMKTDPIKGNMLVLKQHYSNMS